MSYLEIVPTTRQVMRGRYILHTILPTAYATASRASRTHYAPLNLSFREFHTSGCAIDLAFISQRNESMYFCSFAPNIANSLRFGRLSLAGTVLSKRKIIKLIEDGHVHDWDDPRLYTLIALRRRGVPPGALLTFVNDLGVTKAPSVIDVKRFEQVVRKYLETTVPRLMLVLDPIRIDIENLPDDYIEMVDLPFSKDPAYGVGTPKTL